MAADVEIHVGGMPVKGVFVSDNAYALSVSPRGIFRASYPDALTDERRELLVDRHGRLITADSVRSLLHGTLSVPTTAAAIATGDLRQVLVRADVGNVDPIKLGNNTLDWSNGFPLYPGEVATITLDNLNLLFCVAQTTGKTLYYLGGV